MTNTCQLREKHALTLSCYNRGCILKINDQLSCYKYFINTIKNRSMGPALIGCPDYDNGDYYDKEMIDIVIIMIMR